MSKLPSDRVLELVKISNNKTESKEYLITMATLQYLDERFLEQQEIILKSYKNKDGKDTRR